ncbi:MAG: helix-turn-helix domain-containing protein [Gammaproteobacteria bacterium]
MINLNPSENDLAELVNEIVNNDDARVRRKCLIVYLRAKNCARTEVAGMTKVDEDTVTNCVKKYTDGGLEALLENNYRKPESRLEPYADVLRTMFTERPPRNVNEAIETITENTGLTLKNSACQTFLKKIGFRYRDSIWQPAKPRQKI